MHMHTTDMPNMLLFITRKTENQSGLKLIADRDPGIAIMSNMQ